MRYSRLTVALIATLALSSTGCSVQRQASSSERSLRTETVTRDTVWQQVVVAVRDTLREVTTITLQQNDQGDTLKLVQVTDRTRASNREGYRDREEKIVFKTDTFYIEKTDTVTVSTVSGKPLSCKQTGLVPTLKWLFWCILALIALVVIIRILPRRASS